MKCFKCGAALPDNTRFCGHCGTLVTDPQASTLVVEPVQPQHRVDIGAGVETTAGPVWTAGVQATLRSRWIASVEFGSGKLSGRDGVADRDMAMLRLAAGYRVWPWLMVEAGYLSRTYATAIALQRWTAPFVTATARLPFATNGLAAVGQVTLLPSVSVSELESPGLAAVPAVGVECDVARLNLALLYGLERHTFPAAAGAVREEQLSVVALVVQWRRRA